MIKSLFFLTFIVFSAACITTQLTQKESFTASGINYIDCSVCDDGNVCTLDYCATEGSEAKCSHENIVCHSSEKLCADGYLAGCSNFCDNGVCTKCIPACNEHDCKEITKNCTDVSMAKCNENYINGTCITCEPQCICTPKYWCSEWGDCINGFHTRICVDANKCAPDRKETKDCTAIVKEEEKTTQTTQQQSQQSQSQNVYFLEIMYDPSGEETKEEYIVLAGSGDVSGWTISDNSGSWKFPDGTTVNGKIIISRDSNAFVAAYGCIPHIDSFTRGLNNDSDQLTLKDAGGAQRDFVAWEKGASNAYPDWTASAKDGMALRKNGAWHEASPQPC